jgi:hypothetical protein
MVRHDCAMFANHVSAEKTPRLGDLRPGAVHEPKLGQRVGAQRIGAEFFPRGLTRKQRAAM